MEKITLYKNKGEIFKCHLNIDGASIKDTSVRLCLEFDNDINLFFKGNLKENGDCVIEIPILKNIDQNKCKLTVEAIADSIFFKVYEVDVELKNSVEVTMEKTEIKKNNATKIQLDQISQQWDKKANKNKIIKESKEEIKEEVKYIPKTEEKISFTKFQDFVKKKH